VTSFADAYVRLRVDKTKLRSDATGALKSGDVTTAGQKVGKSWAFGFHRGAAKESARLAKGIGGGAGPGIGKLGARNASLFGLGAAGLGAIPAIAAIAATGAIAGLGTSVIGSGARLLIGTKKAPGVLYAQATQLGAQFKKVAASAAQGMLAPLKKAFAELGGPGGILSQLQKPLHQLFAGAGTLILPLLHGITEIAHVALPLLGQAFRAVSHLIGPLLHGVAQLLAGVLPGLITLLRAAMPAIKAFAQILATLGQQLGAMFKAFAPVIQASSQILKALLGLVSGLLPIIGNLAATMARVLAPVFATFAGVIKSMLPVLQIVGRVLAALAKAILADLASALGAVATVIRGIMPALSILAKALGNVFTVLENSGVFAILGNALEAVAPLIARLVTALITGLAPILPPIIRLVSSLAGVAVQLLVQALQILIPIATQLVRDVLTPLLPVVNALLPVITELGKALGTGLGAVLRVVAPILRKLAPFILAIVLAAKAWAIAQGILNIALDANPIGLIALAVAGLVIGIVELVKHWKAVWGFIKTSAAAVWQFLTHGWGQFLIPGLYLIRKVVEYVRAHWAQAWASIKQAALDVGQWLWTDFGAKLTGFFLRTLPNAIRTAVGYIGKAWGLVKSVISAPVKWVIDHVIDGLISAFDWISGKVGGPHINPVHPFGLAAGGLIRGGRKGVDSVLGLLMPDELVVPAHMVRAGMVDHLRGMLPGFAAGGRVGQAAPNPKVARAGSKGPGGILGGLFDAGRILAALFSGNTVALTHAIGDLLPHGAGGAVGSMAALLAAVPGKLLGSIAKFLISTGGIANAGNIVRYAMSWIGRVPYVWGGTALPGGADCCLIGSMRVQTDCGPKEIRELQRGDVVYSWNDGKLATSRVVRRSAPRYQQTYQLRTLHREITASGNHPFLTLRKTAIEKPHACALCGKGPLRGRGLCNTCYHYHRRHGTLPPLSGIRNKRWAWASEWVELDELRRGDIIVTLKNLPDEAPVPDDSYLADKRFLWLLGLAFGDGTMRAERRNSITLCVFGDLADETQDRLEDYCGKRATATAKNGLRLHSERLATGLHRYGMSRDGVPLKSTERQLPRELWSLPHGHIQAFLDGYTAADGHRLKRASDPALNYKAANWGLVEDVRNLHMILGHNVTRVCEMRRIRPITIRGKAVRNARSLWTFEAYEAGVKTTRAAAGLLTHGLAELFPQDSHFMPQMVTSIVPLEENDTYDITVENTHNFVAEGLVVHNSGFTQAVYGQFGISAPRTSEEQWSWVRRMAPRAGGLAFYVSPGGGAPPGHVAIVRDASTVISQGGGLGPQLMPIRAMPLMGTGVPPAAGRAGGVLARFDRGGWLTEAVAGIGLQSGSPYLMHSGEAITNAGGLAGLAGLLHMLIGAVRQNAWDTADGVAGALGGAASTSMYRAEYSPRG